MNVLVILLTSYLTYIVYFVVSAEFSFSNSIATRDALFSFPQFWLAIFLISSMTFLYDLALNFISLNFFDEPNNLLRRYVHNKRNNTVEQNLELEEKYEKMISEYDIKMRNLYKVERVRMPKLLPLDQKAETLCHKNIDLIFNL